MNTMRAVLIKDGMGPAENLYIGETATPTLKPTEVLVKIRAFGLNRMDILQREGRYSVPAGASPILGVEFSGHVAELGSEVTNWKIGDEVLGLAAGGAYAEYIAVALTHIVYKPKAMTWAEAASVPENFLTAFQAIVLYGDIVKGNDVLVHAGASGVGIAAIQLAHLCGARYVFATASTQEKLDYLLNMPNGATHVANYKTEDFSAVVKQATENRGVDIVVDFVGQSHWSKNINSLGVDGRMVMLAMLSGSTVPSFNLAPILSKRLRIQGSLLRARSPEYQTELIQRFSREALGSITGSSGNGAMKTYIHRIYPWAEIQDAHREMEANKNIGKIIVEVV